MRNLQRFYKRVRYSEFGVVALEYALLLVLIAVAIIVGASALGVAINNALSEAAAALS